MSDTRTLEEIGIPQQLRDHAKILWLLTLLLGLGGWIICGLLWKVEGQEENEWFQYQLRQAMWTGLVGWIGYVICGLGVFVHLIIGLLGFLAINGGKDFDAPIFSGLAKK